MSCSNINCFEQDFENVVNQLGTVGFKKKAGCESCPCTLVKCANIELCGIEEPCELMDTRTYSSHDICRLCNSLFLYETCGNLQTRWYMGVQPWQRLEFIDATEPCAVCLESKERAVKFPFCTHYFCTDCTFRILYGRSEEDYHLSPVPFGCPPCPNGCVNPVRGEQCGCLEYNNNDIDEGPLGSVQQWEITNPVAYAAWYFSQEDSVESGMIGGSRKCPLCRAYKYSI